MAGCQVRGIATRRSGAAFLNRHQTSQRVLGWTISSGSRLVAVAQISCRHDDIIFGEERLNHCREKSDVIDIREV